MLSRLRYNFHGNWHLFKKNISIFTVLIFNTDIRNRACRVLLLKGGLAIIWCSQAM